MNFTLEERPPLLACVEAPELHIRVLWGVEYVMPYLTNATPEDGKVLAFVKELLDRAVPNYSRNPGRLA